MSNTKYKRKPEWLKTRIPTGENFKSIQTYRLSTGLATVCEEARCPNQWECWREGTATFMLMGDTCTRGCRFCSVRTSSQPPDLDPEEPKKLSETIQKLKLKYLVLTTVDRDDLPDFGASHIASCVEQIKKDIPSILIEVLIPDFQGNLDCIELISKCNAEVIGHNIECTKNLTKKVRDPRASYQQSLDVLSSLVKFNSNLITKSSIMVGFGESESDVVEAMSDLRAVGVDILTIGQYLQPSKHKLPVEEYITPEQFLKYKGLAENLGFEFVASGPLVRSSYKAAEHYLSYRLKKKNEDTYAGMVS